jgi:hypothetical protein
MVLATLKGPRDTTDLTRTSVETLNVPRDPFSCPPERFLLASWIPAIPITNFRFVFRLSYNARSFPPS